MNGSLFSQDQSILGASATYEDTDPNLISMLSIMGNMLFFLLVSFGVGLMSLIAANVPTIAEESTIFTVSKTKIIVALSITDQGYSLTASNEMMSEADLAKIARKFPMVGGKYDTKSLNLYMYDLKKQFSESDTVVMTPDPEILYEVLVDTMDASRERLIVTEGKTIRYPLFPAVVVSTLVK